MDLSSESVPLVPQLLLAVDTKMAQPTETYRRAFADCDHPHISYGLPFSDACAKHVEATFKASKVYILASKSLANNTDAVEKLEGALGDKVVGVRKGMKSHTLWSECIEVAKDAQEKAADLLVTIGSGSLTDAAKMVILVRTHIPVRPSNHPNNTH